MLYSKLRKNNLCNIVFWNFVFVFQLVGVSVSQNNIN